MALKSVASSEARQGLASLSAGESWCTAGGSRSVEALASVPNDFADTLTRTKRKQIAALALARLCRHVIMLVEVGRSMCHRSVIQNRIPYSPQATNLARR